MYVLQREDLGLVPVPLMVVARSRKHCILSFGTDGDSLRNIMQLKMER